MVLSGQDEYVYAPAVQSRFKAKGFSSRIICEENWSHGGCVTEADPNNVWDDIYDFVTPVGSAPRATAY